MSHFPSGMLRYLDHNTDIQFSKHNFEVKENSSCQSPLTLSAPSFSGESSVICFPLLIFKIQTKETFGTRPGQSSR